MLTSERGQISILYEVLLPPPTPQCALRPCVTAAGSGRVWTSLNSKESNMKVPSCGAVGVEQTERRVRGAPPPPVTAGDWEANLASHPVGAVLSQAQRRRDHPH